MNMTFLKNNTTVSVYFSDGTRIVKTGVSPEDTDTIESLVEIGDIEGVKSTMIPEYKIVAEANNILSEYEQCSVLIVGDDGEVCLDVVPEKILPKDLADRFVIAGLEGDKQETEKLTRFWELAVQNPNPEVVKNLFWFMDKWGHTITSQGLVVLYRNVTDAPTIYNKIKGLREFVRSEYSRIRKNKKAPKNYSVVQNVKDGRVNLLTVSAGKEDYDGYTFIGGLEALHDNEAIDWLHTDVHSKTTDIRFGVPVAMPREDCNSNQNVTCSTGLHGAGPGWLKEGYYGNYSIMIAMAPNDAMSIPPNDDYGKVRMCRYYPIEFVQRDDEGNIIEDPTLINSITVEDIIMDEVVPSKEQSFVKTIDVPTIPNLFTKPEKPIWESVSHRDVNYYDEEDDYDDLDEWDDYYDDEWD